MYSYIPFDRYIRRPGQSPEKVNRGMILAPVAGIILNLLEAGKEVDDQEQNDIALMFAGMDCAETVLRGFYLMECNWVSNFSSLNCILLKSGRLDMFIGLVPFPLYYVALPFYLQNPPVFILLAQTCSCMMIRIIKLVTFFFLLFILGFWCHNISPSLITHTLCESPAGFLDVSSVLSSQSNKSGHSSFPVIFLLNYVPWFIRLVLLKETMKLQN